MKTTIISNPLIILGVTGEDHNRNGHKLHFILKYNMTNFNIYTYFNALIHKHNVS